VYLGILFFLSKTPRHWIIRRKRRDLIFHWHNVISQKNGIIDTTDFFSFLCECVPTYSYVWRDTCSQRRHTTLHCLQKTKHIFLKENLY